MSNEDTAKTTTPAAEPGNLTNPDATASVAATPDAAVATVATNVPSTDPTAAAPGDAATNAESPNKGGLQAEALSDGTVPTVLDPGAGPHQGAVRKGRASLTAVYQRADIITTIVTFVVAIVAAGIILGGYLYLTRSTKKVVVTAPQVSALDQKDLEKLGTFFGATGNGASGGSAQVLTISSSALFSKRVAINNDLKVTGGISSAGPTNLGDLTVDKTSTLGVTNIRAALNVAGPLILQSPAILNGGATAKGDLSASGNGTFGGSLSAGIINAQNLAVTGNLSLNGHLIITGQRPTVSLASESGSGASANIDGSDSAGTVSLNTGNVPTSTTAGGGLLINVTFRTAYGRVPRVLLTPVGQSTGGLPYYVQRTATGFTIGASSAIRSNTGYAFDYWVIQ